MEFGRAGEEWCAACGTFVLTVSFFCFEDGAVGSFGAALAEDVVLFAAEKVRPFSLCVLHFVAVTSTFVVHGIRRRWRRG